MSNYRVYCPDCGMTTKFVDHRKCRCSGILYLYQMPKDQTNPAHIFNQRIKFSIKEKFAEKPVSKSNIEAIEQSQNPYQTINEINRTA